MKKFTDLINDCLPQVSEIFPWDLEERINSDCPPMLLDVREPYEFDAMHIDGSLNVPRGILETACEYNYEETVPELVQSRERDIVVICRSGNRSVLAAFTMQLMGFERVASLKTGLRGWVDYEQALVDHQTQPVDIDAADDFFAPRVRPDQLDPGA